MSKTISAIIIAILVVSAMIFGVAEYNANFAKNYEMSLNDTENIGPLNKTLELQIKLEKINKQLQKDLENPVSVFLSAPITAIKGVILYVQILTESGGLFTGLVNLAPIEFPFWLIPMITTILITIIITFLISRIARGGDM